MIESDESGIEDQTIECFKSSDLNSPDSQSIINRSS